jgi:hypothetical protein
MKNLIAAAATALSVSSPALAGADDVTKYFISQKVTMLEWGMFKTREEIADKVIKDADDQFVRVYYTWDDDKINIDYRVIEIPYGERTFDDSKKGCRHIINEIRHEAGVGSNGNLLYDGFPSSFFTVNFVHNGFETGAAGNEEKFIELDKKIKIRVKVYDVVCIADLLGSEIAFVE